MTKTTLAVLWAACLGSVAPMAYANPTSPFVPAAGGSVMTLRYSQQSADQFFAGDKRMDLPGKKPLGTARQWVGLCPAKTNC